MSKKRGRPRKDGPRYANGHLKPVNNSISPTLAHRSRQLALKAAADPRLGSELGRLFLDERITSSQYAAGLKLAELYGRVSYYDGTKRSVKSSSYEMGFHQAMRESDTDVRLVDGYGKSAEASLADPTQYEISAMKAEEDFRAVRRLWPDRARYIIERLCVDDEPLTEPAVNVAKSMLDDLIKHFGTAPAPKKERAAPKKVVKIRESIRPLREIDYGMSMLQRLRPDLSRDYLLAEWNNFDALRNRDVFRSQRENRIGAI